MVHVSNNKETAWVRVEDDGRMRGGVCRWRDELCSANLEAVDTRVWKGKYYIVPNCGELAMSLSIDCLKGKGEV